MIDFALKLHKINVYVLHMGHPSLNGISIDHSVSNKARGSCKRQTPVKKIVALTSPEYVLVVEAVKPTKVPNHVYLHSIMENVNTIGIGESPRITEGSKYIDARYDKLKSIDLCAHVCAQQ